MATLQEIMAAKKAAKLEAANKIAEAAKPVEKTMEEPVNKEEPAIVTPKPLSFAEKMALKKQANGVNSVVVQPTSQFVTAILNEPQFVVKEEIKEEIKEEAPKVSVSEQSSVVATGTCANVVSANNAESSNTTDMIQEIGTNLLDVNEDEQAYQDIKTKIDALTDLSAEPLENAMRDLKKALMQNPAAVSFMQDSDIGQMVIALRKITGEAIVEAAEDGRKKNSTKKAALDLTDPNVVAQVLEGL